ncbi:pitrilysin family protein [Helicobacter sp. 11S02629-2]|uniref:M16 family metallopeptidase n=1 Tax=Helicobacter sp. 11S02629-2 TaxID=1476195 RepID=UPI000BA7CF94|nr:pitrilysin family protein [Helicobacter sp. 11S02629-2]PAF45314.1 peptidase M16 [Helicobacter sp. 11S02629-2]
MSALSAAVSLPFQVETLKENGLNIVVVPLRNGSNVIETDVIYNVGSGDEKMGKSGIAHMIEHMNFKSTKNLKAGEFDTIVKRMGGVDNASTGFDYTRYFIKSSSSNLDTSLKLFADLMGNLTLKDSEFQTERQVVMQERLWRTEDNPIGYLYFRFFNTAFVYSPYHWTPIGFHSDILNWNIKDLKDFHKTYYQPTNATVLIVGDIDPKEAFAKTKKYFGNIKNKKEIPAFYENEPDSDGEKVVNIHRYTGGLEYLALGFRTSKLSDKRDEAAKYKDKVVLDVLGYILGGTNSSLLDEKLSDELKLTSDISSFNMKLKHGGVFFIIATMNKDKKASDAKDEILKVIQNIKERKISEADLDKAKAAINARFLYSFESSSKLAGIFASFIGGADSKDVDVSLKHLKNYIKDVNSVNLKDLQDVSDYYFTKANLTTLTMSPKSNSHKEDE